MYLFVIYIYIQQKILCFIRKKKTPERRLNRVSQIKSLRKKPHFS